MSSSLPRRSFDSNKKKDDVENAVSTVADSDRSSDNEPTLPQPPSLTPQEERALYRKIDTRVVIILGLMYMLPFTERTGNANLLLTNFIGNQANVALMILWIPFCLFVVPFNLVFKKFRPSRWLPGIGFAWGAVMVIIAFSKTYEEATAGRFFLGLVDASFPVILYYLTLWYPRDKLQYRIGLLFILPTCAAAVLGIVEWLIGLMSGVQGLLTWSWIFIILGILNMLFGILALFVVADSPATATFLTPEERAYVIWQKRCDYSAVGESECFAWRYVWAAFKDWQVWLHTLIFFSVLTPLYGITLFLYSLVAGFGLTAYGTVLITIPPYALAIIVFMVFSNMSDRFKMRSPFILAGMVMSVIGFAINISNASIGAKYFGVYLCIMGSLGSLPGVIAWLASNLSGQYKRATGMALQFGIGSFAGGIATLSYQHGAPDPTTGHAVSLAFLGLGFVTIPLTVVLYKRINAQKDREMASLGDKAHSADEGHELGDKALDFRYVL